jgi:hypothetical protein
LSRKKDCKLKFIPLYFDNRYKGFYQDIIDSMKAGAVNKNAVSKGNGGSMKKPTIVRLDPDLKKKLKHLGIEYDKSLNSIIEEALTYYLKKYQ